MPREEVIKKATALAQVIQAEMQFPVQPRQSDKTRLVGKLLDEVPGRDQVFFQQQGGEATPKSELGRELVIEERMLKLFFCVFHDEFALDAGTDIDHVFAFDKIRQKQINLLKLLNTDREFADIFLARPGIDEFFRRDMDARIKGTSYFFKLCYNDIGNLLLMCHACNIKKSTANPLEWFRQQEIYFGERFIGAVTDAGGLQDGIILPKIYRPVDEGLTLNISGDDINLYTGDSQGLGAFAFQWFFDHFQSVYAAHADFYKDNYGQFKEALDDMRLLIIEGDVKGAREKHRVLRKMLNGYKAVYTAFVEAEKAHESDTESDGSGDARRRHQTSVIMMSEGDLITHEIKKIKKLLVEYYPEETAETLCNKYSRFQDEQIILSNQWREIVEALEEYMIDAKSLGHLPTVEAIDARITELYRDKADAVPRLTEQVTELDHQKIEAERRAEEEARMRVEADQRNAELMVRLARYEGGPGLFDGRGADDQGAGKRSATPRDENPDEGKRARGAETPPPKRG